ncbi:hypothetical protein BVG80_14070 [Sphingobacteriales bacterium TSM_CSM]|nr:hypothetical protein BVG80_14070 [Sphingobacteriales bacterium TSM_CSM]
MQLLPDYKKMGIEQPKLVLQAYTGQVTLQSGQLICLLGVGRMLVNYAEAQPPRLLVTAKQHRAFWRNRKHPTVYL